MFALGIGAAGLLVPFAPAPPAAAHAELLSVDPAKGARLSAAPSTVKLRFNEPVSTRFAQIAVTGPDGKDYADGKPNVSGDTATVSLRALGPEGKYTVGWRVVSSDGHPVNGSYSFRVGAQGSGSADSSSATGASESGGSGSAGQSGPPIALIAGGVLLLIIVGGLVLVVRQNRRSESE